MSINTPVLSIHQGQQGLIFRKNTENGPILWPIPLHPWLSHLLHLGCLYLVLQQSKQTPALQEFISSLCPPVNARSAWGSQIHLSISVQLLWLSSAAQCLLYLCSFSPNWTYFSSVSWKQLLPLGHFSCPFSSLCLHYFFLEVWRLWIHTSQRHEHDQLL